MDDKKAEELLDKYLEGTCSRNEKLLVEAWYNQLMEERGAFPETSDFKRLRDRIYQQLPQPEITPARKMWYPYAAAVLLLIVCVPLFFYWQPDKKNVQKEAITDKIVPGSNTAILSLADGRTIQLDEESKGSLAIQGGAEIVSLDSGTLAYKAQDLVGVPTYNTLSTPRGGQFKLTLPDGTNVWLNAQSAITYPTAFTKNERHVVLSGEAYFEVAHDKSRPFVVKTDDQEVEVLGTHFNIQAYEDEHITKTTLLEGSVRVSNIVSHASRLLKPRQQAILAKGHLSVQSANTEQAIAWKNGYFMFVNDENIRNIMRKVARWYNVEVVYVGNMDEVNFTGTVSRFADISELLEKLELTGMLRFNIEGRKVTLISNIK